MNANFTKTGQQVFNDWFAKNAGHNVNKGVIENEVLESFAEAISMGDDPSYELGGRYTLTGRPSILRLSKDDIEFDGTANNEP